MNLHTAAEAKLPTARQHTIQSGMLAQMPSEVRQAFYGIGNQHNYPQGAILFREQDPPRGIFVVIDGQVKVTIASSEGKTIILRICKAGDLVGLPPVLSGEPHTDCSAVIADAQLLFIRRDALLRFLRMHPETALLLAQQIAYDYRLACEQIRALGLLHSAPKKLAGFLLELTADGKTSSDHCSATLGLTHEEIGQIIGASRETVTRTLSVFKANHFVSLDGSSLRINNRTALEHFAEVR